MGRGGEIFRRAGRVTRLVSVNAWAIIVVRRIASCAVSSSSKGQAMGYESIEVTPMTPRIGASVAGIKLANPLSNREVDELHQALAEHQVLFFRNQPMDVE